VTVSLNSLLGRSVVAVAKEEYVDIGYSWIDLSIAEGPAIRFYAREIDSEGAEFYSIDIAECPDDRPLPDWLASEFKIEQIEIVRRDEWVEKGSDTEAVGTNPRTTCSGKVGSAPPGVAVVSVTCGIVLASAAKDMLLVFTEDFPGLIGLSCDASAIRDYESSYTVDLPETRG
jgi:hypothetical protein